MRYNSGSYVENKGISVLAGAMGRIGDGASLGGYVETGGGKYESFNDFAVKGSGDLKYAGAGIVSEFDLAENFYAKSGAQIGLRGFSGLGKGRIRRNENLLRGKFSPRQDFRAER